MRIIVYSIVAIALIWIGVFESASLSVADFNRDPADASSERQIPLQRLLAVGLVGEAVISKIANNGRHTVISEGNERFLVPNDVLPQSLEN